MDASVGPVLPVGVLAVPPLDPPAAVLASFDGDVVGVVVFDEGWVVLVVVVGVVVVASAATTSAM